MHVKFRSKIEFQPKTERNRRPCSNKSTSQLTNQFNWTNERTVLEAQAATAAEAATFGAMTTIITTATATAGTAWRRYFYYVIRVCEC